MKNKASSSDSNKIPAWMVTFADLMALMMTFFVLLYSFSNIDKEKYKSIAISMSKGFDGVQWIKTNILNKKNIGPEPGIIINPAVINPAPETEKKQTSDEPNQNDILFKNIKQYFNKEIENKLIHVEQQDNNILIRFPESASFPSGSDQLRQEISPIIQHLGTVLKKEKGKIVIAGHTDNNPISTDRFRSNWELSTSRAIAVAYQLLKTHKVHPHHIVVVGYSDTQPLVANDTEENRAKNRRVEIIISKDKTKL